MHRRLRRKRSIRRRSYKTGKRTSETKPQFRILRTRVRRATEKLKYPCPHMKLYWTYQPSKENQKRRAPKTTNAVAPVRPRSHRRSRNRPSKTSVALSEDFAASAAQPNQFAASASQPEIISPEASPAPVSNPKSTIRRRLPAQRRKTRKFKIQ